MRPYEIWVMIVGPGFEPAISRYKVKMMMMDEPEHVRLDGNEHEFDYEEEDKKVLIPIREKYLDEPTKIKVL